MTTGCIPPSPDPDLPEHEPWDEGWLKRSVPEDDELDGWTEDPLTSRPPEADDWLAAEPDEELADWYDQLEAKPVCPDPDAAWFAAGCPGAGGPDLPAGVSVFSSEEAGESLEPGGLLAGLSEQALQFGMGSLNDDALIGLVRASRRLAAWQDGIELAAVAELDARRMAAALRPRSSRASEHVSEELALALVLTGRAADSLLGLARELVRLPMVVAGLMSGAIDRRRAEVFVEELRGLDDEAARTVADAFADRAASLTTGQLRRGLRAMVLLLDPAAARKRAQRARGEARVEVWQETSGNGAISGRELPAADMLAADARITAIAKALRSAGAAGTLDQVRADVFRALLVGRDPETLLDVAPVAGSELDAEDGGAGGSPAAPSGRDGSGAAAASAISGLAGSVHLTLPAATWLGWADAPGELPGYGPIDPWTARDLARRLGGHPAARWHVTLTDQGGRAVAHACARTRPPELPQLVAGAGPPGGTGSLPRAGPVMAWLARLEFAWLELGECTHRRATRAYRPSGRVRELIAVRNKTCAFPGCRRPARRCDADHTRPWDDGGLTCECNLASLCRRHHRAKQGPGWHVEQREPGVLTWTAPHGRTYTSLPEAYLG